LVGLSEAGLTDIATASLLPKATTYRLLQQLCDQGAVERHGSRYRVGHRMFQLGHAWQPHPGLWLAAHDPIRAVAQTSGVTTGVYVLRTGQAVVVGGVVGDIGTVLPSAAGTTLPWRTAAAKVLVASSHTATMFSLASASWLRERETIREQGVAFDREEVTDGVCCAAVPVRGGDSTPIAAVAAITTPGTRLPQLAQRLRRASEAITAALRANLVP
jgi:DNA-binding IclR family transcriptional regulator